MKTRDYVRGYKEGLRDAKRSTSSRSRRRYRDDAGQIYEMEIYYYGNSSETIYLWATSNLEAIELAVKYCQLSYDDPENYEVVIQNTIQPNEGMWAGGEDNPDWAKELTNAINKGDLSLVGDDGP